MSACYTVHSTADCVPNVIPWTAGFFVGSCNTAIFHILNKIFVLDFTGNVWVHLVRNLACITSELNHESFSCVLLGLVCCEGCEEAAWLFAYRISGVRKWVRVWMEVMVQVWTERWTTRELQILSTALWLIWLKAAGDYSERSAGGVTEKVLSIDKPHLALGHTRSTNSWSI